MASMPLFVLPLAYFFNTNEALDRSKFIGLIIGFLGIVILFSPDFTLGDDTSFLITLGKFACILAAFCYASNSILMRKLPSIDPVGLAAMSLLIGSVWVVLWAIAIEGPPPNINTETLIIWMAKPLTDYQHPNCWPLEPKRITATKSRQAAPLG